MGSVSGLCANGRGIFSPGFAPSSARADEQRHTEQSHSEPMITTQVNLLAARGGGPFDDSAQAGVQGAGPRSHESTASGSLRRGELRVQRSNRATNAEDPGRSSEQDEDAPRCLWQPRIPLPDERYFETLSAFVHFPGVSLLQ